MSETFEQAVNTFPGIGDNKPPSDKLMTGDELTASLEEAHVKMKERAAELLAGASDFYVIESDEDDGLATQYLNPMRDLWKEGEAARTKLKAPYLEGGSRIDAFFKRFLDKLVVEATKIGAEQTRYKKAKVEAERKKREEEARIAREAEEAKRREAERLANEAREAERAAARKRNDEARQKAEAEAAAARQRAEEARQKEDAAAAERAKAEERANASNAELSRARGPMGGMSSLRTFVNFRDLDRDKLNLEMLRPFIKEEHLKMAIRAYADGNKASVLQACKGHKPQPITGVTFFEDSKSASRT